MQNGWVKYGKEDEILDKRRSERWLALFEIQAADFFLGAQTPFQVLWAFSGNC